MERTERMLKHRGYVFLAGTVIWLACNIASAQDTPASAQPSAAADQEKPEKPERADASDADSGKQKPGAALNPRAQNSWHGSSGGLHLIDGSSGEVGSIRLQLGFDYFRAGNTLFAGDLDEELSGVLSLSATPIEHLEIFGSLSSHANSNTLGNPQLLQVAGDLELGAKGYQQLLPWLSVAADARLLFLDTVGDLGVLFSGTSLGLRGAATADLRHIDKPLPLIVRANLGYLFDNSSKLIENVEQARYLALPVATRRSYANEDRNLVTRIERFGLGIDRVDMFSLNLGVEAPVEVATDFYIHPLLEWQLGIPVNRQGYSCLSVATKASIHTADGCLAITGLSAAPSTLTLGARVLPPVRGLSALLAFDIGLSGTSTFVRELAPNRPWAFIFSIGYAIDTRKPQPEVHYLIAQREVPQPIVRRTRVHGVVVERGFGVPIVGATVSYPDRDLTPQLTVAEGRFTSYELEPGETVFAVSHPDYESGRCVVNIPAPVQAPDARRSGLTPLPAANGGAPATPTAPGVPAAAAGNFVELRCELVARPRTGALQGSITGENGAPVANIVVQITGPESRSVTSDAGGAFTVVGLPAGDYVARVDAPTYLLKSQPFTLALGADTTLSIALIAKPKTSQVVMTASELKIGTQIMFKVKSAEIDARSTGLLSEIADTLQRNPRATRVQVQGHTDNRGDSAQNQELSQQRAEAVVTWLVQAGVDASRLEAKGYGDSRPLVPNLTPDNRARNRRVQFIIKKSE